jgi:hypothetical protein
LRSALERGEAAGLQGPDLEGARRLLGEEERKTAARSALRSAVDAKDVGRLGAAIHEGESVGLLYAQSWRLGLLKHETTCFVFTSSCINLQ